MSVELDTLTVAPRADNAMHCLPHAITHLTLDRFRNYESLALTVDCRPVVLVGSNGAGKTNILEALSLFSPGRGLRQSSLKEMETDRNSAYAPNTGWAISVQLASQGLTYDMVSGRDKDVVRDTRIIKINGERMRRQSELCQYVSILWLSPQMDSLFLEGNSTRRRFLDRLVYSFDPQHAVRVSEYEHAMRERSALLKERLADGNWLYILEAQMAAHSVAIAIARQQLIDQLIEQMEISQSRFATSICSVSGVIETWLKQGYSALEIEGLFVEKLKENRGKDAARGRASDGVHKSRFEVIHKGKNRLAELCSTGEQKSLLLSLLIHHAKARAKACLQPPILLLDEVVSHLDVDARKELFDALIEGGMQAWMTGTDAADFLGISGFATWVDVKDATAKISI